MKGTDLPELPTGVEWKIGGEAEVSWQVRNNHGGGESHSAPAPPLLSLRSLTLARPLFAFLRLRVPSMSRVGASHGELVSELLSAPVFPAVVVVVDRGS